MNGIDVVDEVLNGEAKYRISRQGTGEIVEDDVLIELTTQVVTQGTPLNKALFDLIAARVCPAGLICMWSGTTVPTGWHLCDGTDNTPDLRNKFIVGSGDEYTTGTTGGASTHTLLEAELPAHKHTLKWIGQGSTSSSGTQYNHLYTGTNTEVKNTVGKYIAPTDRYEADTEETGSGTAIDIRPPYYALAYIIKM